MCKFTTRKFVVWSLSLFVILGIFSFSGQANAQSTYPMRNLTLDTKGKTLLLDSSAPDREGKLNEYVNGVSIKDWKVKYEHKGSSRFMCEPPVLNMSFDKTDKNGNPKELFTGVSTYENNSQLQYQKIRLIPDCDIWNDYWLGGGDVGFDGQLDVNLREYIIHKIFRAFGVPTADVVAFTNITFVTPDTKYNGKTFRYMIIQRPQELDDQIPFTKQYNLNSSLYESGSPYLWNTTENFSSLTGGDIKNSQTNQVFNFSFDQETSIRFLLLTDFLNVGDMGFLHNEDGGIDLSTGKMKRIPHGFDASFSCYMSNPDWTDVGNQINQLSGVTRSDYQVAYYRIARDIFGDSAHLDQMIAFVDKFPYNDVDKSKLREYLKIRFYQYASYFNSKEFADDVDQTFSPRSVSLPFGSKEEYQTHHDNFLKTCNSVKVPLSGVSVSVTGSNLEINSNYNPRQMNAKFTVEVKTTSSALQVLKNGGSFQVKLVGEKNKDNNYAYFSTRSSAVSGAEDYAGPYYEIAPNTTAKFEIEANIWDEGSVLNDNYHFELVSFQANNKVEPVVLSSKTETVSFGTLKPIVVTAPKTGDVLSLGSQATISWEGSLDRHNYIYAATLNGDQIFIDYPDAKVYNNNQYVWTVGKGYQYNNGWKLTDINPGSYKIIVQDAYSGLSGETGYLTVGSLGTTTQTSIVSSEPKLSLSYDPTGKESSLVSTFDVSIEAGQDISLYPLTWVTLSSDSSSLLSNGNLVPMSTSSLEVREDSKGQMYYFIPQGQLTKFKLTASSNPKIMFAGLYKATLSYVYVRYGIESHQGDNLKVVGSNTTNSVAIIGETSPYITGATQDKDGSIVLKGLRFASSSNTVTLGSKEFSNLNATKNGTELSFKPVGLDSGKYSIVITNMNMGREAGRSNTWGITIEGVVAPQAPTITFRHKTTVESDFSTGDMLLPSGTEVLVSWSSTDTESCVASANPSVSTWTGDKSTDGLGSIGKVDVGRTYKLTCKGPGGSKTSSFDVMPNGKIPPKEVPVTPATSTPTTPVTPTTPADDTIKLIQIWCNKGDWVGKNSVVGMWAKKGLKYNPDPRFLCHTDKTIYRCATADQETPANAAYWNTFSTKINNGAVTPNYTCDTTAGKWVSRTKSGSLPDWLFASILSAFNWWK